MGNRSRNRSGNDNPMENQPDHMILRQSILKRIGHSKNSDVTNTITSTKNQTNQNQCSPRSIPHPIRIPDIKTANIISTDSDNNPKTGSSSEPPPTCKYIILLRLFFNC